MSHYNMEHCIYINLLSHVLYNNLKCMEQYGCFLAPRSGSSRPNNVSIWLKWPVTAGHNQCGQNLGGNDWIVSARSVNR